MSRNKSPTGQPYRVPGMNNCGGQTSRRATAQTKQLLVVCRWGFNAHHFVQRFARRTIELGWF
jgi:hypothetical protein